MAVEHFAALACTWLATYFIHSTLMLAAVWIATGRSSSRFDRLAELAWRAALVLPIATSLTQQILSSSLAGGSVMRGAIDYTPSPLATSQIPAALWLGVTTVWMLAATLGLAQLYRGHRMLRRQAEVRAPLPKRYLDLLAGIEGIETIPIGLVGDLPIPFALRSEIVLPTWILDRLTVAELRAVVAHEVAHVRRCDAFWRCAASAVLRSFVFQPLNWIAESRLRELSECICDDEAVAATDSAISLAGALECLTWPLCATRSTPMIRRAHLR
ncbi:MAG: M56 family metallopeptidase [Gemmatimonadaceae bacterium]